MSEAKGSGGDAPKVLDVVILGSGCAGLTAAVYSARANLKPLLIDGHETGGQLSLTTEVENYPGFPQGILGPELIENMRRQAERFGTSYLSGAATAADLSRRPFRVTIDGRQEILTRTLIIASGASARMLGLPSEKRLLGHGVSTCATCDGFFFRGKEIAVIGGGDSAMEEATFLSRFASRVTVIHRRAVLRASKIMQDRAFNNPKIAFLYDSSVDEVLGGEKVEGIRIRNLKTGQVREMTLDGLFVAIGHVPNTRIFAGQLEMDQAGYLITQGRGSRTNVPGVFAAGDCQDHVYRQAITAAGSGCMAAIDAERFLEAEGH
ncbi:MAG TPA: thioredoxin-disulfide reductase [Candidatus Polarisedimenticolia bacterium]|nr:thioredoxin-disulfide reductase [Candidatus Polarisedimenticolia bacterium]